TELKATLVARVPKGGYVVPPAHAGWVRAKLELHGIRSETLRAGAHEVSAEVFRASKVDFAAAPFEGRTNVKARGAWSAETVNVAAGSLFVPTTQPGARLLVHLLEPEAPDSLVSWGYFSSIFEQKEYMEAYVAEAVAARMLKEDPA